MLTDCVHNIPTEPPCIYVFCILFELYSWVNDSVQLKSRDKKKAPGYRVILRSIQKIYKTNLWFIPDLYMLLCCLYSNNSLKDVCKCLDSFGTLWCNIFGTLCILTSSWCVLESIAIKALDTNENA